MSAASAGIFLILAKMNDGNRAMVCFSKEQSEIGSGLEIGPVKKLLGMRDFTDCQHFFSQLETLDGRAGF